MIMADVAPLLQKVAPIPIPPFMLNEKFYDALAEDLPLESNTIQPTPGLRASFHPDKDCANSCSSAPWTFARKRPSGEKLPQTIAHRGFKTNHPENTMGAFKGAATSGAHAIETDIHITKDGVLVLSHVSAELRTPQPHLMEGRTGRNA